MPPRKTTMPGRRPRPARPDPLLICCQHVHPSSACPACGKLPVHDWNVKPQSFWRQNTNTITCEHCLTTLTCTIEYGRGITISLPANGPAADPAVFGPADDSRDDIADDIALSRIESSACDR